MRSVGGVNVLARLTVVGSEARRRVAGDFDGTGLPLLSVASTLVHTTHLDIPVCFTEPMRSKQHEDRLSH